MHDGQEGAGTGRLTWLDGVYPLWGGSSPRPGHGQHAGRLATKNGETIEIHLSVQSSSGTIPAKPIVAPTRGPLAGLMASGRLTAGDRLILSQPRANRTAIATVRADGALEVQGKTGVFWSPSKAATAITGSQINGWTAWRKEDGGATLDELRTEDEEREGYE